MPPVIHFDLDGTLVEAAGAYPLADVLADRGITVTDAQVADFRSLGIQYFQRNADAPYHRAAARWTDHHALDVDPDEVADAFVRRQIDRARPVPGIEETIPALAAEFTLGVITNGIGRVQRAKLAQLPVEGCFENVVVSAETPYMKPDDGIFELAREALPGDAHVYVADRLAFDIVPAMENGFSGVWIADDDSPIVDLTVQSVAELTPALLPRVVDRR